MANTNPQISAFTNVLIDRILKSERRAADHKNDLHEALQEIIDLRAKIEDFEAILNAERQDNAQLMSRVAALEKSNATKPSVHC